MQQLRMKKLKNYYSLILFFLLVSTQVKAQSVDVLSLIHISEPTRH